MFRIRYNKYKDIRLSSEQLQKLSDITADLGLVCIASIVLPAIFDRFNILLLFFGILVAIFCFVCSLVLIKAK